MNLPTIVTSALTALRGSPHFSLRRLEIVGSTDSLIVTGKVSSFFLKQMAQETLRPIVGKVAIVNRVDVVAN